MHRVFFDWYEATVHGAEPGELIEKLAAALGEPDIRPSKAMHGYLRAYEAQLGGLVVFHVMYGGNRGVHIRFSGQTAIDGAAALRELYPEHNVTRADVRIDWIMYGLFDTLNRDLCAFAESNGITLDQSGDWVRGKARTRYLGATSSVVRICLYEKGYLEGGDPNWVRLEIRVRPKGVNRAKAAIMEPVEFLAVGWVAQAMDHIALLVQDKQSLGRIWKPSDTARARAALIAQYGPTLLAMLQERRSPEVVGRLLLKACHIWSDKSAPEWQRRRDVAELLETVSA